MLFLQKINYHGMISQSSGEDWLDCKISLSTAAPSIGGNVPELATQNVRIKPKPIPRADKSFAQSYAQSYKSPRNGGLFGSSFMAIESAAAPMRAEKMSLQEVDLAYVRAEVFFKKKVSKNKLVFKTYKKRSKQAQLVQQVRLRYLEKRQFQPIITAIRSVLVSFH